MRFNVKCHIFCLYFSQADGWIGEGGMATLVRAPGADIWSAAIENDSKLRYCERKL